MTKFNRRQVAEIGALHADLEAKRDLQGVMHTLGPHPSYEYPLLGIKFQGRATAQRFYEYFFENFSPHVVGYTLLGEWVNDDSVTQEYAMTLDFDGVQETHQVLGILWVEGDKLGGERVYASEQTVRRMIGPIFYETVTL